MLITDSFMGIIAPVVLISTITPRLLLVPVLFLLAFVITVRDYARQLNPVSTSMRERFGTMNAGLAETIAGIEVVKGNAQEAQEQEKFVNDAAAFRDDFMNKTSSSSPAPWLKISPLVIMRPHEKNRASRSRSAGP